VIPKIHRNKPSLSFNGMSSFHSRVEPFNLGNKEPLNDKNASKLLSQTPSYLKRQEVDAGTCTKNNGKFDTVQLHKEFMELFNEANRVKTNNYPRSKALKLLTPIIAIDEENIKSKKTIKKEKERKAKAGFIRF
jgi:hypothetical protein